MDQLASRMPVVDLSDPEIHAQPGIDGIFAELRNSGALYWTSAANEPSFWSATTYAHCERIQKDSEVFGSASTNVLGRHRVAGDTGAGKMLNASDPPRHTELRAIVKSAFSPSRLARLESYARTLAAEAIETAIVAGDCDFVDTIAMLPVATIASLMGVPRADWPLLLGLTRTAFDQGDVAASGTTAARAHVELLVYCSRLLRARRQSPGDDLVSDLAQAQAAGKLTEEEVLLFFDLLMLGGNETTRHAAVGGLLALAHFPEQWSRLSANANLIATAVPEVLRWTSPSRHVLRCAKRDVWVGESLIRRGQDVAIWHVSANRDPTVFWDPDCFDISRRPNPHLAFGSGIHFCLGSALATLELRAFLEELVGRVAAIEPLEGGERLRSTVVSGYSRLRVRLLRRK